MTETRKDGEAGGRCIVCNKSIDSRDYRFCTPCAEGRCGECGEFLNDYGNCLNDCKEGVDDAESVMLDKGVSLVNRGLADGAVRDMRQESGPVKPAPQPVAETRIVAECKPDSCRAASHDTVVARCYTCARLDIDGGDYNYHPQSIGCHKTAQDHRAAGHDVRPVGGKP